MKKTTMLLSVLQIFLVAVLSYGQQKTMKTHALSLHGDIKYSRGFSHFDYVDPDAPKGGTVRLAGIGTFDSLNPFILKGVSASGLGLLFDTLTEQSADEPFSEYGLLAEEIELPKDRSWIAYTLRKQARWHDGTPVTADDVVFTFNTLREQGAPFYRYYYGDVVSAEALSDRKVRFVFKDGNNPELPLIIGQLPVLSKRYYSKTAFDRTSLDPPMGSGPYRILDVKPGRSITYTRDPGYWGKDLPVNRGRFNFDTIKYEYYRDETVVVEAFKAGEYDFRSENVAKIWATAYRGPNFDKGYIVTEELPDENPNGMQAWVFNTRRLIFADRRVRQALAYLFDFEWTNKTIFYGQYKRITSYFENSEFASKGLPGSEERALLEPFRNRLPKEVFEETYLLPSPRTAGDLRPGMRTALRLLGEAGWRLEEGRLLNRRGEQFEFEFLIFQPSTERVVIPFVQNLEKIGIKVRIRTVDASQYVNRLDNYDFDMTTVWWRQSLSPGNEQRDFWSSEAADRPGTRNLAGIKDPVVDALIEKIISAPDKESLLSCCRALDRVLLWGHYVIPNWYSSSYRVAYWNKFSRPAIKPRYALGFPDTWWVDPKKEASLTEAR
ncbi:MAG: ABC transporter substrate-binding protein [Spirochaetes bacterium]|nr:ABC transporter substrate-binding protein [Spirochaetota bacterium]